MTQGHGPTVWDLQQYRHWLDTVRFGGMRLREHEEAGDSSEERQLTALNIQIAWGHLIAADSPYRDRLSEEDRRTVTIARALTGDTDERRIM